MERYKSLFRDTWWLWILYTVFGVGMSLISPIFWLTFPICIVTFLYFGYVRYDEDGSFKGS